MPRPRRADPHRSALPPAARHRTAPSAVRSLLDHIDSIPGLLGAAPEEALVCTAISAADVTHAITGLPAVLHDGAATAAVSNLAPGRGILLAYSADPERAGEALRACVAASSPWAGSLMLSAAWVGPGEWAPIGAHGQMLDVRERTLSAFGERALLAGV